MQWDLIQNLAWLISLNQVFVILFSSLQELPGWSFTTNHNGLSFYPIIVNDRLRICTSLNVNTAGNVRIT